MNANQWEETQSQLRRLETLLPKLPESTPAWELGTSLSSLGLSDEAQTAGWRRWMAMMIRRGWKYADDGNLHRPAVKGLPHIDGAKDISRPAQGFIGPWRQPWDQQFNPRTDAPAAIRGATMISPNRYRYGLQLLDANGAQRDEENECPVCGCLPSQTYRVVRAEHPNPFTARNEPWKQAWRPCPRCAA